MLLKTFIWRASGTCSMWSYVVDGIPIALSRYARHREAVMKVMKESMGSRALTSGNSDMKE